MGGGNADDRAVMIRGLAESWPPHRLAYAPALLPGGEKNLRQPFDLSKHQSEIPCGMRRCPSFFSPPGRSAGAQRGDEGAAPTVLNNAGFKQKPAGLAICGLYVD